MALPATTYYRARTNALDTNGGCFDEATVGAGTDYSDSDTPVLSVTNLASIAPYTTITTATGGFTTAMIGNGIYIASGTGFVASRYIITGVTNTNTATVHEACATAAASGGTATVGGAIANPFAVTSTAPFGLSQGGVVYIRGQGSNDPIDIDYNAAQLATNIGGNISYIGYNGRPKIGHTGRVFTFSSTVSIYMENLYWIQTAATGTTGVLTGTGVHNRAFNCVFDVGGFDAKQMANVSLVRCSFINTGNQATGTAAAVFVTSTAAWITTIKDCLFKDLRGTAISVNGSQNVITGNMVQNCGGDGIYFGPIAIAYSNAECTSNTIYGCAGHGISVNDLFHTPVSSNIVANITGSGKYGLEVRSGSHTAASLKSAYRFGNNVFFGNTTNANITLNNTNLTVDPQFVNAPLDLTPTNLALRYVGGVGAL